MQAYGWQFAADLRGTTPGCKALPASEPLALRTDHDRDCTRRPSRHARPCHRGVRLVHAGRCRNGGPQSDHSPAGRGARSRHQPRARRRLAQGRYAGTGARACGQCLRRRARPSALAPCPAERRRSRRRDQCAQGRGHGDGRVQGLVDGHGHELRRRGRSKPQPHRAAARRRRRRHGGDEARVPRKPQLALRHGAHRRQALCRRYRRAAPLRLSRGRDRDRDAGNQDRRSPRQPRQLSLDQEPRRESRRVAPLCRGGLQQQCRRERSRLGGGESANPRNRSGHGRGAQLSRPD